MTYMANKKGYSLVGTTSFCNNAFYVRNDLLNDRLNVLSAEEAYSPSNYRESRDENGNLTFILGDDRLDTIRGLPIFEVEKQTMEKI
jgi:hypothetical protein